jgi:UrcA family protein
MAYRKLASICAGIAMTAAGLTVVPTAAWGRPIPRDVIVVPQDVVVRDIGYGDLNLATDAGEKMLNSRVRGGIKSLCIEALSEVEGAFGYDWESAICHNSAWTQAKPQMAQAVQRAREIALTGRSNIAAVAISIAIVP